ncbi:MAG TPA: hypothetical protein VM509_15260 [Planctomycetota bacterium]|nr:hypothetical protein [Planctomycetota bacterium]
MLDRCGEIVLDPRPSTVIRRSRSGCFRPRAERHCMRDLLEPSARASRKILLAKTADPRAHAALAARSGAPVRIAAPAELALEFAGE